MSESQPSHPSEVHQTPEVATPTYDKPTIPIDIGSLHVDQMKGNSITEKLAVGMDQLSDEAALAEFQGQPTPPDVLRAMHTIELLTQLRQNAADSRHPSVTMADDDIHWADSRFEHSIYTDSREPETDPGDIPPIAPPHKVAELCIPMIGASDTKISLVTAKHPQQWSHKIDLTTPQGICDLYVSLQESVDILPKESQKSFPVNAKMKIVAGAIRQQFHLDDDQSTKLIGILDNLVWAYEASNTQEFNQRLYEDVLDKMKEIPSLQEPFDMTVDFPSAPRTWIGLGTTTEDGKPKYLINAATEVRHRGRDIYTPEFKPLLEVLEYDDETGEYRASVTCLREYYPPHIKLSAEFTKTNKKATLGNIRKQIAHFISGAQTK